MRWIITDNRSMAKAERQFPDDMSETQAKKYDANADLAQSVLTALLPTEWAIPTGVYLRDNDLFIRVDSLDDWTCQCGNMCHTDGFYPSDRDGNEIEPEPHIWEGLMVCGRCHVILTTDGRIVGQRERFSARPE